MQRGQRTIQWASRGWLLSALVGLGASACESESKKPAAPSEAAQAEASQPREAAQAQSGASQTKAGAPTPAQSNEFASRAGPITLTPLHHGTFALRVGDTRILVDPTSKALGYAATTSDLILVTDIHGDHLDAEAIGRASHERTQFVWPSAVAAALAEASPPTKQVTILANGETAELAGIHIEAVAMYNHTRGPKPGQLYHEKGRGNGYVLTIGGQRIYISGDTACTDEMKALENIDVALVCMNLPYTMTPEEAAGCVAEFKPKIVYPYHHRGSDLDAFESGLKGQPEIEVRRGGWYPPNTDQ